MAIGLRQTILPTLRDETRMRLRRALNILLAVFVIGLMETLRDLTLNDPLSALMWLAYACVANFMFQLIGWTVFRRAEPDTRAALALISGNRNFALFFVALAPEFTTPVLAFLACYQVPMYLTPIVMRRLYAPVEGTDTIPM